ncbi:Polyamine aminopropyltransferase [Diplonema papillatum]|nr:Polyamine aminopropyltransferase [Diplonema papillatum]
MLPTFFKAATTASVVLAALSATVYVVVHYFLGLQHVTCFGGTFGLFGDVSMASKPFIEYQVQRDVAYLFGMTRKLYEMETNFQHIEVYAHRYFGHVLVIDGSLQITERDEVNYHEMTAHIPMAYFPDAKKVLVIGGGDGGALLQLLMHPNVETAHLVDIDMFAMRDMVAAYFPYLHSAYLDPRTRAFAYDGRRWVDEQLEVPENHHSYEVVVLDSTDYGAAESLFTEEFYKQLKNLMATTSILVANVDSPSWNLETVIAVQLLLSKLFKHVYIFHSNQPTFLSGHYSYVFCSDEIHPMKSPIDWNRWAEKKITTYYYNEDVHYASFVLPEFIRSSLLVGSRLKDLPLGEKHPFATRVSL